MVANLAGSSRIKKLISSNVFRVSLSVVVLVIVFYILAKQIKPSEVQDAVEKANLWWVLAAFVAGAVSWVGAAIPLKALASIRISLRDATLVQVASSFVGVVAPMGLGPVAMHLDYLKRRGMSVPAAAAIVAFIQLAQVVVSVGLLLVALLFDHDFPHVGFPLKEVALAVGLILVVFGVVTMIPKVRGYVTAKLRGFWSDIQPQILWVRKHPVDLVWALLGVAVQTVTFALALMFSLYAAGHPISLAAAIVIYLVGNTLGSAVPTPGGMGSTLAALVGSLHLVGVPTALAASGALLFRLVTFYLQVPIGWVAFAYMQRKKLL